MFVQVKIYSLNSNNNHKIEIKCKMVIVKYGRQLLAISWKYKITDSVPNVIILRFSSQIINQVLYSMT